LSVAIVEVAQARNRKVWPFGPKFKQSHTLLSPRRQRDGGTDCRDGGRYAQKLGPTDSGRREGRSEENTGKMTGERKKRSDTPLLVASFYARGQNFFRG